MLIVNHEECTDNVISYQFHVQSRLNTPLLSLLGVANGKIRDSPRPLFENLRLRLENFNKIRARDSVQRKLSPRLHFAKNQQDR